jgi:hypothetical protein
VLVERNRIPDVPIDELRRRVGDRSPIDTHPAARAGDERSRSLTAPRQERHERSVEPGVERVLLARLIGGGHPAEDRIGKNLGGDEDAIGAQRRSPLERRVERGAVGRRMDGIAAVERLPIGRRSPIARILQAMVLEPEDEATARAGNDEG